MSRGSARVAAAASIDRRDVRGEDAGVRTGTTFVGFRFTTVTMARGGSMADREDRNAGIIQEFRANHGKVGGYFEGRPLLLLTARGAKSGAERTTPLAYLADGERFVIFATKGGAPTNPDWYYNLAANPDVTIEVGDRRLPARARVTTEPERTELYRRQAERWPAFAEYPTKTSRSIPVIVLEPADHAEPG
jgi:deazaflavin-dependent oxidoreductase (nitroreductase family)